MKPVLLGAVAAVAVVAIAEPWTARARPLTLALAARTPRRAAGVAAVIAVGVVAPPVALAALLGWWARGWRKARRRRAEAIADVRASLPDTVDLLRLTTTAGLSLALSHPLVASHAPGLVGVALRDAAAACDRGATRADALVGALSPLGERARGLADVLGDHLRYGVPLLPGLDRIGLELRLDRRRAAELEARRVPVRLLGPLVTCVLPAFALLTVVPLLVASLAALPL